MAIMRWRARLRGLMGVAAVLTAAVYLVSEARLEAALPVQPIALTVPPNASLLERGRHLGEVVMQCPFCHGDDWGGTRIADDPIVGRLYSSNLTPGRGGIASRYSDADLARAIRSAVGPSGKNLWFMPSEHFSSITDADLAALITYVRALPPVDREHPERWPGPATRVAVSLGLAPELVPRTSTPGPTDHESEPPAHAPDTGRYLVDIGICASCHLADLRGGRHPLAPPHEPVPPDLRPGGSMRGWSQHDFVKTMRTGVTPDGRVLSARYMPWLRYGKMKDAELEAIFGHLSAGRDTSSTPPRVAAGPPATKRESGG